MKKIVSILMIALFSLSLIACTTEAVVEDDKKIDDEVIDNKEPENICGEQTECIEFVEQLLSTMSIREKAGQMVQAERGSISAGEAEHYGIGSILSGGGSHPTSFNNSTDDWYNMYKKYQEAALDSSSGIPLIYGIDAVHGNNNLYGATIFPHNIGLGAANDHDLTYEVSKATAEEMLTTGINWTFAPALSVVQNISWGRTYEGFSENSEIHSNLTQSAILGFEDNGVSASAKHFFADGGTQNGSDQGNVVTTNQLESIHLAPYYEAINADVDTIMISYSSIDGNKMHGASYWINDILKDEMGFKGFIISDWNAIHQLPGNYETQIIDSVNAGVDMLMEPFDWKDAINSIVIAHSNNKISIERIDDAVRRILTVKFNRGLFDDPLRRLDDTYLYNEEHKNIAIEAVEKSLVLLKNDNNALPLNKDSNIYITGSASDNVGLLCGGWTTYWQGNTSSDIGVGTSIKEGFSTMVDSGSGSLVSDMNSADTVVVVLSENPYSEGSGDNTTLTLTSNTASSGNSAAIQTAKDAKAAGKIVIGILVSGRPLLLQDNLQYFDAFVAAWLPGSEGGTGISNVLFGDVDFTGKLSYTWPINSSQIGYNSNNKEYDPESVLFPYGYGLSYE